MLRNYLSITLRNLRRQKVYASINIAGLAVGLACCILILLFVRHELSYDRFHENADRTYRLTSETEMYGPSARIPGMAGEGLARTFPEIETAVRLFPRSPTLRFDSELVTAENFLFADRAFFEVFDFPLTHGDAGSALAEPYSIVLTESAAKRYFGESNVVGRDVTVDSDVYRITAVAEDPRANSHLTFDFLASYSTLGDVDRPFSFQGYLYLLLRESSAAAGLEEKVQALAAGDGSEMMQIFGYWIKDAAHSLEPITSIQLRSPLNAEFKPGGDIRYIYIFSIVALLILGIACGNYVILATARAAQRSVEVGVRKAVGANRRQLIQQFLGESILLCVIAMLLAVAVAELALPAFGAASGRTLSLPWNPLIYVIGIPAFAVMLGLLSGWYPALLISRFRPAGVLKGIAFSVPGRFSVRRMLVLAQLTISVALIICVGVVQKQMHFIQNLRLGFDKEQVVTVPVRNLSPMSASALKDEMDRLAGTVSVSLAAGSPLGSNFVSADSNDDEPVQVRMASVDHDYVRTMGLEIVEGRDFSAEISTDAAEGVLVNEAAIAQMNLSGIGDQVRILRRIDGIPTPTDGTIVGIVRDFHHGSLHEPILPTILYIDPELSRSLVIRIQPGNPQGVLSKIESVWNGFITAYPFSFLFLVEQIDALYLSETRLRTILGTFALLAILIACLGLFGLAAYTAEQRTKEIGIRKVLGATVTSVVTLLSKDFAKLVVIATVIAAPIGYYVMSRWLEEFAYRIEISWWIFVLAGCIALLIALLTVSSQAVKAAVRNPVEALRYE